MILQTPRLALGILLSLVACAARPGDFHVIGPGGGGAQYNPSLSPHDPNTVLVSCDMTGAYITHDGGKWWRMFNLRGTVKSFVFDPRNAHVIYANVTGLWRSTDDGETWKLLYPKPSSVKGIRMASDHADETILADPDPLGSISAFAIDPEDSKVLYASASKSSQAALFVSRDSGETWTRQANLPGPALQIWIASNCVFLATEHSIVWRTRAGIQTIPGPSARAFSSISGGWVDGAKLVLYGTAEDGAFVSQDGGATWRRCDLPGNGARVQAIATSLRHPEAAYLSFKNLELKGESWSGVAKTTDYGRSWQLVWKEAGRPASNVHDAWITPRFGPDWAENPLMLGVAENDPNLCYATDLGRTMKTSDGGRTWDAVYSRRTPGYGWASAGLDVTTSYGIHFDPFDHRREFITYTDIGLFRSEDEGRSWVSSTEGVPREWLNTTYWVVFDPEVKGRMWSVNSDTHDLPRPKMWRRKSTLNYKGGVCISEDGGKTWRASNEGMEETAATHILLDPQSPRDARTLYVAAFGRGVYKSTDSGRHWMLKNNGITQTQPFAWRLARVSDGTLYVLLARRSENGSIGNEGDGAIYRSTDGAKSWRQVRLPEGVNAPNGLAIDPASPHRLYLAAWARAIGVHGEGGGIYLSEDAGESWRQVLARDQHVYDVTIDPHDANVLYAAGFESSAWRSVDRGEHWNRIPGFNFKWCHRVIPDPEDRNSIYVTTFGGSVWHGAVNGPDRPVDIVTPNLEPGYSIGFIQTLVIATTLLSLL